MYSVSVLYGSTSWLLMYREEATAKAAIAILNSTPAPATGIQMPGDREVSDDFGQTIYMTTRPTAVMFEDMEKSKLLHVEHHIHRAHIQQDVIKRAETDQALRARSQGPAILTPNIMGAPNGGFRGN